MPLPSSNVVQQIILLATGAPASVKVRNDLLNLYASTGNWQSVAALVDQYMNDQIVLTHNGVSGLIQAMASNGLGMKLSDSEAVRVTHDLMEQGIDTWPKLFTFVIDEMAGELRQVLDQRSAAAEDFTDLLSNLDKDGDYHGFSTLNAAREWVQGIGQSSASLLAAQQSAAELIGRFNEGAVRGTVLNGYISGATVFIDENDNGVLDAGERSTLTDESGEFSFAGDVPRGHYVVTGGVDLATGKPYTGRLIAPEGAVMMTPLTMLINTLLRNGQVQNIDAAEAVLFKAFELPRVDLSVFDPIASGLYDDARAQKVIAVKIQATITQVVNLLNIIEPLMNEFVPRYFRVDQFALNTLVLHLINSANTDNHWLDLSDVRTLTAIIKDTATSLGILDDHSSPEKLESASRLAGQAAELLHEMNALIQQSARQFETGRISSVITTLSDMVKVQTLTQTKAVQAIAENVLSGDLESVISLLTSKNLLALLDKVETGFLNNQTPVNSGSALTNIAPQPGSRHAPKAFDEHFLNFDGTDDYVQIGNDPSLEMTATMTMEAWIKRDSSNNANQMIINKEGEYEVGLFPDGTVRWAFKNAAPGWDWYNTGHVVSVNEWTHLAVSYDNGTIKTYANGTLVHTYNGAGVIGDAHPALDDLRIGGRSNNPPGKYFDGAIREVRIWNVARTGAEISANYNQHLSGTETGLVGNWRLTEGTGVVVNDLSSQDNEGTLGGGVTAQEPDWTGYTLSEDSSGLDVPAFLGVLSNDSDDAGHSLTAMLNSDVSHGTLNFNSDGSFTYTPDADFSGTDSFTYRANDGIRNGNSDTITITVSNVNDAPVISSDGGAGTASLSVNENVTAVTVVTASDADTDDTLSYSISGGNDQALFDIDSDSGALSFSSAPDFETPLDANTDNIYEVTVRVDDGQSGVDSQVLSVTVVDIFGF